VLGFQTLTLVGLLVLWAGRSLWEGRHPAVAAARQVRNREAPQRILAIRDLERFGPEDPEVAIPALSDSLRDTDAEVRAAAAMALVMVVHNAGVTRSAQAHVRRAVGTLFDCLKDPRPDVRAACVQALWMIAQSWYGASPAIDLLGLKNALIEAATDPDAVVRLSAVRGLAANGPRMGEDPPTVLTDALEDETEKVRTAAAEALVQYRRGLLRMLPSLVRSFEKARPDLRAGYTLVMTRIRPRAFTEEAVPSLASALVSPDEEIRSLAAAALAAFGEKAYPAIPALIATICRPGLEGGPAQARAPAEDRDPVLAAAQALIGIIPQSPFSSDSRPPLDPESLTALARVLRSETPQIRAAIAAALGRFRPTPAVIPVLGEAVGDSDAAVRAASLRALHDIGEAMPFVPPGTVAGALDDESPLVRYWAAGALGHAGLGIDPFVPALLRHAEHDPDPEVRSVCATELWDVIKPPAVTPSVVPVLIRALDSPDRCVRWAACGLLARLGPAAAPAIPTIIRLLKQRAGGRGDPSGNDPSHDQPSWAAAALGQIAPGTPQADQAAMALTETFQVETTQAATIASIQALARFGPLARGAIPRLRELVRMPNRVVRDTAYRALATLGAAN
jgi:HEAT repeat protein